MEPKARSAITFAEAHPAGIALGVAIFVLTIAGSLAVVAIVLLRLPEDYLQAAEDAPFWPGRPAWLRAVGRLFKNALGVLLVAAGAVMAIPGVPGQGVLTIMIGIMLLDLPGKRRLERRIVGRPRVLAAINRFRVRFGRPPLIAPSPPSSSSSSSSGRGASRAAPPR